MQRLLSQIGRSQRLAVINLLKRNSAGLPVKEMSQRLNMSYMGVKQICLDLERDGFLETFRRHRGVGRPELLYLLTPKAHDLFPKVDNSLPLSLLEQAGKLFGATAPSKMLYRHYQEKAAGYAEKLKGQTLAEKVRSLAQLREREGYMAEAGEQDGRLQFTEKHNPLQLLMDTFPEIAGLERDMFQKVLGAPVAAEVKGVGGQKERVFFVG